VTTAQSTPRRRPRWAAFGVLLIAAQFLAGPAPGDVGGCGGDNASTPVPGSAEQSEYDYFDQGLCSHMCLRLYQCGLICDAIVRNGAPCNPNDPAVFRQCVRGEIRADLFGVSRCPHRCNNLGAFAGAFQQDIAACGNQVLATSCDSAALTDVIRAAPEACTVVCR
jgi:hypothetical protein